MQPGTTDLAFDSGQDRDDWQADAEYVVADAEREPINAPYGINPSTGRPYTKSPEERAAFGERMANARVAAKTAGRSTRTPPRRRSAGAKGSAGRSHRPAPQPGPEVAYAQTAAGLLALVSTGVAILGKVMGAPDTQLGNALVLDSMALSYHVPPLATAVAEAATQEGASWLASALDKAGRVSPWGNVAMAVLALGGQLAANHGIVAPNPDMGVLSPDELVAAIKGEGEQA